MESQEVYGEVVRHGRVSVQNRDRLSVRFLQRFLVYFALASTFMTGAHCIAQTPTNQTPPFGRLTVRPHDMAAGTENMKAGVDTLDSLSDYFVYVPKNCVGKRRVPLVVYVHGGGWSSTMQLDAQRDLADKYGMILLLPNSVEPGAQDVFVGLQNGQTVTEPNPKGVTVKVVQSADTDVKGIDAAMKQVLRKYAIDPDKIAVMGFSNGGSYSLLLGRNNLDIFSRVGGLSALYPFYGSGPQNDKAMFLLSGGDAENMVKTTLAVTQELRDEGRTVETVLALRGHIALREDDNYAWNWLARSWGWKTPASANEGPPRPAADSDPVLTADAIVKMTTFWSSFMQEPDSIATTARKANQEYITMSIGQMPVTVVKTNMIAMAAKYPSVAADLSKAGLTAQQEEAYRAAIIRVGFTRLAGETAGSVAETSVLGKNLALRVSHPEEFKALSATGMWTTQ